MSQSQKRVCQIVGIVLCMGMCVLLNPGESQAGIGGLLKNQVNKVKDKVKSEIEEKVGTAIETDEEKPPQDANPEPETAETTPEASAGSIVFSASPIDVENPADLTSSFTAGQTIYSLITVEKPWKEIYAESGDSEKTEIGTVMFIDGKRYFQYITVTGNTMDATHLLLDIAPKPDEMTAYRDPEVSFPDSMGSKWGPAAFTDKFSQLEAGEHTVEYQVIYWSDIIAKGSFTVTGEDFSAYADLHSQIRQELDAQRGFPAAQMTDKNMENTMLSLCQNSELTDVKKLHIISKDWWYERVAGGDSAYKARYLETAVAAQDGDGCYYSIVTFHQDALLGGGWGSLYLSHIGSKKRLPCENIQ